MRIWVTPLHLCAGVVIMRIQGVVGSRLVRKDKLQGYDDGAGRVT